MGETRNAEWEEWRMRGVEVGSSKSRVPVQLLAETRLGWDILCPIMYR